MVEIYTDEETDKIVLEYLKSISKNGYSDKINPLDFSAQGISKNTNLELSDIIGSLNRLEKLDALSALKKGKKKIFSLISNFILWFPNNKEGKEIKDELCKAKYTIVSYLHNFIGLVFYIIIFFTLLYSIRNKSIEDSLYIMIIFSFFGFIISFLLLKLGRLISERYGVLAYYTSKMKHFKSYTIIFVSSLLVFLLLLWTAPDTWITKIFTFVSLIAAILTIVTFFINLNKERNV